MSPRLFLEESRSVGFRKAASSFSKRRHLAPALAYLVLAFFTAFSFAQERTHSNDNRNQLATETHKVLLSGCIRNNELRVSLQQILSQSAELNKPALKKSVASGQYTQEQADAATKFTENAVKNLAPVDCAKVYPEPELAK